MLSGFVVIIFPNLMKHRLPLTRELLSVAKLRER